MEKIKFNPNERNRIHWTLCNLLFEDDKDTEKVKKVMDIAKENREGDNFIYEVDLKINGEQFNLESLVNNLVNNYNRIVENAVKEKIKENFYEIESKTNDILENLDYLKIKIEEMEG